MWEIVIVSTVLTLNTVLVAYVLYRVVTASVQATGEVVGSIAERLLNPYQPINEDATNPQENLYLSTSDPREIAAEDWAPGPHQTVEGPGWTNVEDPLTPGPDFETN